MRPANPSDLQAIVTLLDRAFAPSRFESRLIEAMVTQGRPLRHWVIEGEVGGSGERGLLAYICYSNAYRAGRPIGYHLAPVAVHPEHQRRGIGSALIHDTLIESPIGGSAVFVLGDPTYYARFGFRHVTQPTCPFDPGNEHFMALRYESRDEFEIGYEPEFMMGDDSAAVT